MNLGLISLIALLAAIVIGFVRKANVGILCIGFSMILGLVYGIKAGDIIKGFSSSLCMQMIGITYLFAIINENGTLELLAKKMVALVGPHKALIPFVMYLLGFLICAVGPGAIPSLAIVPVIAIPVAVSAGVNPIMTAIIGDLGVMSGRMSPLTPESARCPRAHGIPGTYRQYCSDHDVPDRDSHRCRSSRIYLLQRLAGCSAHQPSGCSSEIQ